MKMKKYIVEAPEPKEGQNISTGGVRENGKMASQFRNPVPYEEPVISAATHPYGIKEILLVELKEIGLDCARTLWCEVGAPALKKASQKLGQKLINAIDFPMFPTSKPNSESTLDKKIIDADAIEIMPATHDNEKIVHFPSKRVG